MISYSKHATFVSDNAVVAAAVAAHCFEMCVNVVFVFLWLSYATGAPKQYS